MWNLKKKNGEIVSESESVFPMNSELAKNGYLKEPKISGELGVTVSSGNREVLLSGVLPGRI